MKKIFKDVNELKAFMAKNEGCKVLINNGQYEVTCKDTVDMVDADDNNHITQEEVIKHFGDKEIVSKIDTDKNGRITKKELKTFVEKNDK